MKKKIIIKSILFGSISLILTGCLEERALEIQKLYTYSEEYYQGIREYKASSHTLSYAYYAAWAPVEGVSGYKDPASWGERIRGLPDSLDICNLWMGIPSNDPTEDNYAPVAYEDMKYCQENLGTRFVSHTDAANTTTVTYNGVEYNMATYYANGDEDSLKLALRYYAQTMIDDVIKYGLDGVDIDYEPNIALWNEKSNLTYVVQCLDEVFGENGEYPEKLVIVDFFSTTPAGAVEPYIDYLVKQQYSHQLGTSLNDVNDAYAEVNWCPPEKYIIIETFGTGTYHLYGGAPFYDENEEAMYSTDGSVMYSIEAYARWNPSKGNKAGFGAYYLDRNYYSASGVPYREFRRAIQIANSVIE